MRDGWRTIRIGDLTEVRTGGTPRRDQPELWNGAIPWMSSGEIHLRRVSTTAERISQDALRQSNAKWLPTGSVMIALNGQGKTRGAVAVLIAPMTCNQSLAAILPSARHDPEYLFQFLDSRYGALRALTGDGRSGLNLDLVRNFHIALPPIDEQRGIAAVLSAFDVARERHQRVVEALDAALDAVVEGLGAEGDEVLLGDLIAEGPTNGIYKPAHLIGDGALLVGMTAVSGQIGIDWAQSRRARVEPAEIAQYGLRAHDVLVRRVYARVQGVGLPVLVPTAPPEPAVFESNMMRVRLAPERAVPRVVVAAMHSRMVRRQVEGAATLAAQASINGGALRALRLRLPNITRQREAGRLLEAIDQRLAAEREIGERLRESKGAVCQSLLRESA